MIWRNLTWPRKSLKFNLHHLEIENVSTGFKMTVLSPKLGIMRAVIFVIFIPKQPVAHVLKLKGLLKMLKNSQTNTCAEVFLITPEQVLSSEFVKFLRTLFYKEQPHSTSPVLCFHEAY